MRLQKIMTNVAIPMIIFITLNVFQFVFGEEPLTINKGGAMMENHPQPVESYSLHRNEVMDFVMGRYLLSSSPMTQSQALSYCEAARMQLVAIGNGVENNEVTQFLEFTNLGYAWTSGKPNNYDANSYRWVVNDQPVTFMNFQHAIPNIVFGPEEWPLTGILLSPVSEKWLLDLQIETHHALCEKL